MASSTIPSVPVLLLIALLVPGVSAAAVASVARQMPAACGAECAFSFCDANDALNTMPMGPTDVVLTGAICRDGVTVGHIDESAEACIDGVPISQWVPSGLTQPFAPSFFKVYSVLGEMCEASGVGHQYMQGNQADFLIDVCVVLPIREYQLIDPVTCVVLENIPANDKMVDCVAFTVNSQGVSPDQIMPSPGMLLI